MQFEALLEDADDIEMHIESLTGNQVRVETISMAGLPKRERLCHRGLQVKTRCS